MTVDAPQKIDFRKFSKTKMPPGLYERNGYWSWRDRLTGKEWGLGRIPRHEAIRQVLEAEALPERLENRFPFRENLPPLATLTHDEIVQAAIAPTDHSGVYFLVSKGVVMYVGQSMHVARRISEHLANAIEPIDAYHWIQVPLAMLNDTEAAYIQALKPARNRNMPRPA